MSWLSTKCVKCDCDLVAPEWRVADPNNLRAICGFCDSKIPKFIKITKCHGYPMFWSDEEDHLRCVVKHCDQFIPRPDQPFVPQRYYHL